MSLPRNTNSSHIGSLRNWLKNERHILYLFVTYGLLVGLITYFYSFDYSLSTNATRVVLNLPAFIIIYFIESTLFNPLGFDPFSYNAGMAILGSVLGWTIIGFVPYMIIKFYRFTKKYPT